jgi:hypothetical protein
MTTEEFFGKELEEAFIKAVTAARLDTLRAGVPVYYLDDSGIDVMEMPDGRKFEIRFIPHKLDECNYEVVREIRSAA